MINITLTRRCLKHLSYVEPAIWEALRRMGEGAEMIRTKGEPGTGNVIEAVRHIRQVMDEIRWVSNLPQEELMAAAKELQAPYELVVKTAQLKRLPVVNFAAGGIATPADAAMMMQLGCDGIFVGSGIFKSGDPVKRARAIVAATTNYNDPAVLAEVSKDLGRPWLELISAPSNRRRGCRSEVGRKAPCQSRVYVI